jgi:drug/metabolite transporter (DMT)-like permease
MVLCAGLLAGVNGTASYLVLRAGLSALQLTLLRTFGAFVILLIASLATNPRRLYVTKRQLVTTIPFALTGFFGVPVLYLIAISRIPVGVAVILEYLAPVLVALWARQIQRRPVHWRLWIGLGLCLLGLVGITGITRSAPLSLVGLTAGFGAALLLAAFYLLGERAVVGRDPLSLVCWSYGLACIASALVQPWWRFSLPAFRAESHGLPVWSLCLFIVIFGTAVPYLLLANALRFLSATSAVTIGLCEPVAASICAWIFLHERLDGAQIFGGIAVVAGIALAETARTRAG